MESEQSSIFSVQIELLDKVLAASSDHIYISDRHLRYLYASPAGLAALGLQPAQLLGKTWQELGFPPDIMELSDQERQSVFQTGIAITGETSFPTVHGIRYYEYVIAPIWGEDGEIVAVINTSRDISDRQQVEEALRSLNEELEARVIARTQELAALNQSLRLEIAQRQQAQQALLESEMRFHALIDAMFEGIVLQEGGKIIAANPGFARMFGYSLEEVIGKSAVDFLTPESWETVVHHIENQYEQPDEITGIKKDGTLISLEVVGKRSWYQGRIVRVSALRDITERKRAEAERIRLIQQLETEHSRLEQVLQQMPVGVAIAEAPSGKLVFHNQEAVRVLGHSLMDANTYLEYTQYRAIHADGQPYQPQDYPIARSLISGEVVKAEEMHYLRGDGTVTLLSVNAAPIVDQNGQIIATVSAFEDISERKQAVQRLAKEALRIQTLLDTSFDGIVILDKAGRVVDANPRFAQMLGYSLTEVANLSVFDWDAQFTHEELQQLLQDYISSKSGVFETQHRRKDGSVYHVQISANVVEWEGEILRFCICRDITESKQAQAALRESQIQLQRQLVEIETIYQSAPIGLSVLDTDLRFVRINQRLAQINGFSVEAHIGRTLRELLPDLADAAEQLLRPILETGEPVLNIEINGETPAQPGVQRTWLESFLPLKDGERIIGINTVCEEISERKQAESQLRQNAFYDRLTGLPNRALFMEYLTQALQQAKQHKNNLFAVLFLDLDRFKVINDSLGHIKGDQFLITIAQILQACIRSTDIVARLGGDEFIILLTGIQDVSDAIRVAEHIQQELKLPLKLDQQEVFTSASIGIALSSTLDYDQPEQLLRDADTAMYRAKALGKSRYALFNADMYASALFRLQIEVDLRRAIERQEFQVYYQPIVSLITGSIIGFEALLRWQHPQRGLLSPVDFIPLAEETGLIVEIGYWTLYEACRQMQAWLIKYPHYSLEKMSVNLSAKQFCQPNLIEQIRHILHSTGLNPDNLALEITETVIVENGDEAIAILLKLRELGVEISIDDFGTGYSSLGRLYSFPISVLKIDRSFVNPMTTDNRNLDIIEIIVTLADKLGMSAIAEGVERPEQLAILRKLNCQSVQGYFFSEPLDSSHTAALITANPQWC
ncbi:sensor domain-containing protein [Anabaena azotica]|uniref:PAS domain S-box protein n=1 Tax=Anabaena azotica FACHB-119 TaxID=947527 RepID=A0ABR8D1C4_9NOST|nr:EAL domain-containing protein [Anabaena azotica]MBD2500927.1 PAS domain S-box protein [Anabaena azotica FACHB-119]